MELKNNIAVIAIAMLVCSAVLVCIPSIDAEEGVAGVVIVDDKGYDSLKAAIDAAGDGAVLKLNNDVTEDVTVPDGKKIAIDLNGHKLTNVSSDTITVQFGAELTIRDSVGNGIVDNITNQRAALFNNGTMIVENGTFDRSKEAGTDSENSGGNTYYIALNHGVMTINDGTFALQGHFSSAVVNGYYNYGLSSDQRKGYSEGFNHAEPKLTINGGSFSGGLNTIKNDDGAKIDINGGTFFNDYAKTTTIKENGEDVTVVDRGCVVQNHSVCTITGGSFTGNDCYAVYNCGCGAVYDVGDFNIEGGSFHGIICNKIVPTAKYQGGKVTFNGGTFDCEMILPEGFYEFNKGTFNGDAPEIIRNAAEAVVGSTYYASFASAVADAEDGATVGILNDVKGSDAVAIDRNLTIEGNGHKFCGSFALDAVGSEDGLYKVVLKGFVMEGDGKVAMAISGDNQAADVRPVDLAIIGCDISGYTSGIHLTNAQKLLIDGSEFGSDVVLDLCGVKDAEIIVKNSVFSDADFSIAQRGGAGNTDDASDIISESANVKILVVKDNVFTDSVVIIGAESNTDGSVRTYAQAFDAEITSKGATTVRFHGAGIEGTERMLDIVLSDGMQLVTNTAPDTSGEVTKGIIIIKVESAEIAGAVHDGMTLIVNRLMTIPSGASVEGKVWFDTNLANGVTLQGVVAGDKGLSFARGSVVISGDFSESTDGTITVTGIAKVTGELDLKGASLVVPASSTLMVEENGKIAGNGTIRNSGTVKVQGSVESAIANEEGSKVQVGRTGSIDGTKVTGVGDVNYDSIIVKSIQTQYVRVGDKLDIPVTVDPAGAKVVIDQSKSPSWLSISDEKHVVGTAAVDGCYNVTLIVTDGDREPVEESFIVNVIPTPTDPDDRTEAREYEMKDILKVAMILIAALVVIALVFRAILG